MVEILWHGHSCFEIRGKDGTVVTDPFRGIGLPEPKAEANLVLCSHSHSDHNNPDPVKAKTGEVLVGFVGSKKVGKIDVKGIATFHDDSEGSRRGKNSIYVFMLDGINFCHIGDLGHDLAPSQVEAVGKIDVLFVPVGGFFTIGPDAAWKLCQTLSPKLVFPMHYRMAGMSPNFNSLNNVEDFLKSKENVKRLEGRSFTLEKADVPEKMTIIVPKI
jgi:L-ascorbate metabolism protein UlaG (beta-lactamase superfamily)